MGKDLKGGEYINVSLFSLAPILDEGLGMQVEERGERVSL